VVRASDGQGRSTR